ncbi:sugar porter family MFS transporter [Rodentibacter sp. Ppn85]|uniref:sugar porter family MFS transporter n=1 Tax=Rodentibacter sp. Ppn85 TaxID=1908525 RepID=UPI001E32B1FB|nr:sugar porter family MFS transporter [Rodentibacter sp. Ppn85]
MMNKNAVIYISMIAALGGFLFGFDTAVISGTVESIRSLEFGFGLTSGELGFAVASVLIGSAIGAWYAGVAAMKFGRVKVMLIASTLFSISAVGSALAVNLWDFSFWRWVGGLGVGIAAVIAPAYIAEVSPAHLRGRLGSLQQLAIAIGLLVSFISNYFFANIENSPNADLWGGLLAWRWMLLVEVFPAVLYGVMALKLPESPRYLVSKNKLEEAKKILIKYANEPEPELKIKQIQNSLGNLEEIVSIKNVLAKKTLFAPVVWMGISLAFVAQFTGINIILYYASSLWSAVGFSQGLSFAVPIGTTTIGVLMTVVGMLYIDKIGRRKLLLIGSIGMGISLWITGFIFMKANQVEGNLVLSPELSWSALISAHIFYIFFCCTWGPAVWVVLGEIFPNKIRTTGLGIATCANWIGNVIVTWTFPPMLQFLGLAPTYLFYGVCCIGSYFMVKHFIPETGNKALEEMSYSFEKP